MFSSRKREKGSLRERLAKYVCCSGDIAPRSFQRSRRVRMVMEFSFSDMGRRIRARPLDLGTSSAHESTHRTFQTDSLSQKTHRRMYQIEAACKSAVGGISPEVIPARCHFWCQLVLEFGARSCSLVRF